MNDLTIAVLGGSGKEGSGLALRWAKAGHPVILGSRSADKAQASAAELNQILGAIHVQFADNATAAAKADVVVLAVPYSAQQSTALGIRDRLVGKILIDVTVPLKPPKVSMVNLPAEGSAVVALQRALGPQVRVVSAFQNVSAAHLRDLDHSVDCDVLICTDDEAAGEIAVALAQSAGMRGWRCGPLANSVVSEGLTSVLIAINQRYKIPGSGIRITGTPKAT
ncbi:MAG TPA: NADPH-dependent F420 reductase [Steroidobacteraceae bacterium]|jgi:NADPH-dependent F420 reductase|nr:NADPH-dependent F420 reductase [Steroidobacteraceae bacterium]